MIFLLSRENLHLSVIDQIFVGRFALKELTATIMVLLESERLINRMWLGDFALHIQNVLRIKRSPPTK